MGGSESQRRWGDEERHQVTLTKGFEIQATPVTQSLWKKIMGTNPSHLSSCADCPVEQISWNDAHAFVDKLNLHLAGEKCRYRLPTEAEWEYAARAGTTRDYFFGWMLDDWPTTRGFSTIRASTLIP